MYLRIRSRRNRHGERVAHIANRLLHMDIKEFSRYILVCNWAVALRMMASPGDLGPQTYPQTGGYTVAGPGEDTIHIAEG